MKVFKINFNCFKSKVEDADKKETENSDEIENAENDGGTGPSEHLTVKRKKLEEELKVEHSGNLMGKFRKLTKISFHKF